MARLRSYTLRWDRVLPFALAVLATLEFALLHTDKWVFGVALELIACMCLLFRRRFPLAAPTAAILVSLSPAFIAPALDEPATPVAIVILAVYWLARWNPSHRGLIGIALTGVQFAARYAVDSDDTFDVTDVVFGCALLAPPYILGRLTRRLAEQADQLERQQEVVKRAAIHEERDRIARDLHDVIAHSVSAMVVQTAAAQDLIRTDPDRAEVLMRSVADTGRTALTETGRLLHVIRDDEDELGLQPAPGLSRVGALVEQFRASGLAVNLHCDQQLPTLSAGADVSAYRVVQEALTNALKYAPDHAVTLELAHVDGQLRIHTSNWTSGRSNQGSGLGLLGMRERLTVVGGELTHRLTPEGKFDLTATLPGTVAT